MEPGTSLLRGQMPGTVRSSQASTLPAMQQPHPALLGAGVALALTKTGRRLLVLGMVGAAVVAGMRRRGRASWHEVPPPSSAP